MSKNLLVNAMFNDIPPDLRSKLGAKFGTFTQLTSPTDSDKAIIEMGKMCVEIQNKMLVPLSGLPLVDALLYIGSLTPSIISGMFAGLESIAVGGTFDIIAPKDGGVYPGFFDAWTVQAPDAETLNVSVGEDTFDLIQNDGTWSKKWPMPIGDHSATLTDGVNSMTISFSVVSWDIWPPDGEEIDPGLQTITFDPGETEIESAKVTVTQPDGISNSLAFELVGGIFEAAFEFALSGVNTLLFEITLPLSLAGGVIQMEQQNNVREA